MAERVLVAMSGGVDSSVAALELLNSGYDVVGMTMLNLDGGGDAADAERAAKTLGIQHYTLDMRSEFRRLVSDEFVRRYISGDTPNPCIVCNDRIKFGLWLDEAERSGFDYLATGHYARRYRYEQDGAWRLGKAADITKDQSYFLYRLGTDRLARVLFPLGDMQKSRVREIAERHGLTRPTQRESQDICFIPDGDYLAYLFRNGYEASIGSFTDTDGNVLGQHKGIAAYTTGQRRGLGISAPQPLYVISKCPEDNAVVLGTHEQLFSSELTAGDVCLFLPTADGEEFSADIKIRYSQTVARGRVTILPDGRCAVAFEEPQRAVTRGQSVVFYDGDTVLGGGIIE